jgi:ectoine hydroxylase-related dioxygenase (phytanoyl-CoA dioxygenase family)
MYCETDSENYVESFDSDDSENYTQYLKKYGFVVIRDVVNHELLVNPEKEIALTANQQGGSVSLECDHTWDIDSNWPRGSRFLFSEQPMSQFAFDIRTSPIIKKVYSKIFNSEEKFYASIDHFGVMRPRVNNKHLDLHWDIWPWEYKEKNQPEYQGLVALVDCNDSTGSFYCVPGSHNLLHKWCEIYTEPSDTNKKHFFINPKDKFWTKRQRINVRKGSMIIWDSGTLHGNFENTSDTLPRIVLYLRMTLASKISISFHSAPLVLQGNVPPGIILSDEQKELLI